MKLIIEEHQYAAKDVADILKEIDALENIEGYVSVNYVGYFYNHTVHDCVFILPKVLLEDVDGEERVFGKYKPEDIIDLDKTNPLSKEHRDFIYEFAVWIYRAITVFHNDKNTDSSIVYHKTILQVGKGQRRLSNTFLDIILSLIDFNRDNQNFFFYILRNIHSGLNKINWTHTIAHSSAIVQDNTPVYIRPVNKKRQINFDEELLVIFFSILNYVNNQYGFDTPINCNFDLITGSKFKAYLMGLGQIRLRQIKYRYFSDKALRLWELCYAFFDQARKVVIETGQKDYLLVKNFNIVFEAIIDKLVGESRDKIPEGLKDQEDGKRIDHIYSYDGLTTNDPDRPVYYIGDSKYYKRGNEVGKNSVYKQFTYARNVIQWNLNLFLNERDEEEIRKVQKNFGNIGQLRDNDTEGYNVIPNFFISATIDKDLKYKDEIELTEKKNKTFSSLQFKNRLFDRDTLLVCHYDVNFLFVVALYARNNQSTIADWKNKVRAMFRKQIQKMLEEQYNFYAMEPRPNVNGIAFIKEHFKDVLGKVYAPYHEHEILSLALDKTDPEKNNGQVLDLLRSKFFVEPCRLGEDPKDVLPEITEETVLLPQNSDEKNVLTCLVRKTDTEYQNFTQHKGKNYTMERIPVVNLLNIKYLLPMIGGRIDGYYEIENLRIIDYDGNPALRLRLGTYHKLGGQWVQIYRTKMQPGEVISLDYSMNMYNPTNSIN
jgi:hypothetical protein